MLVVLVQELPKCVLYASSVVVEAFAAILRLVVLDVLDALEQCRRLEISFEAIIVSAVLWPMREVLSHLHEVDAELLGWHIALVLASLQLYC